MDIKKLIEHICCDYNHSTLLELCSFYCAGMKKNPAKFKRYDLEQIAFIILSLNIDPTGIYDIYTEEKVILKQASPHETIDFIFKKTLYYWADEPDYPVTKDNRQQRVYVRKTIERR